MNARCIRTALATDYRAVATILVEAFHGLIASIYGVSSDLLLIELLDLTLQNGYVRPESILVCEAEGVIVGTAIVQNGSCLTGSLLGFARLITRQRGPMVGALSMLGAVAYMAFDARSPRGSDLTYIEAIAVGEAYRRQGHGRALLLGVEELARERGSTKIGLHVLRRRKEARAMYLDSGYRAWWPIPLLPLHTYLLRLSSGLSATLMVRDVTSAPSQLTNGNGNS